MGKINRFNRCLLIEKKITPKWHSFTPLVPMEVSCGELFYLNVHYNESGLIIEKM